LDVPLKIAVDSRGGIISGDACRPKNGGNEDCNEPEVHDVCGTPSSAKILLEQIASKERIPQAKVCGTDERAVSDAKYSRM
jgi:hypothetical protein